jgi:phospholipase C
MPGEKSALDRISHIVVLMLENRSFDNVLGWLYDPENKPPFDQVPRGQKFAGLSGGNYYNLKSDGTKVPAGKGNSMIDPFPDPNEPYVNVYAQMYNELFPPDQVPNTKATPPMSGFVIDYARAIQSAAGGNKGCTALLASLFHWGSSPLAYDPGIIMNCFTPERLPVINGLAHAYAVCDHWFSSVPTQTFPNRSFIHAATSSGYVTNGWKTGPHEWDIGYLLNKTDTIYNLLSRRGVDWRIYHGGPFLLCNAVLCQEKLWEFVPLGKHFFPMTQFLEDAKKPNGLPSYTFIEPNMFCSSKYGPENDMHPAFAITDTGLATNVLYGEELILTIYRALRESPDWESTLFIITFDEHGGCYDHVPTPPPHAVAPDDLKVPPGHPGYSGFDFKRYGVRVPAVLISPWIEKGTVSHTGFDHTSVIKTAANRWLDGENLTARDLNATDLSEVLTRSTPRDDDPDIQPNPVPLFTGCGGQPLSDLHRHMLAAAAYRVAERTGRRIELDTLKTTDQVVAELDRYEAAVKANLS